MNKNKFDIIEYINIIKEKIYYYSIIFCIDTIKYIANTKGGIILFGVDDKTHEERGVKNVVKATEKISELINNRIEPLPRYELNYFEEDGKDFIELEIGDGQITPYFYVADGRKEAFIRSGNQSLPAPAHILQNLILKGKNKHLILCQVNIMWKI